MSNEYNEDPGAVAKDVNCGLQHPEFGLCARVCSADSRSAQDRSGV